MKNIEAIIKKITEKWFLTEPVLFPIYCTHSLVSNDKLSVPFRVGRRRIEYAPHILENMNEKLIEECLKIEAIRILLKHPYQRKPYAANPVALSMASNVTINDACEISKEAQEFLHGLEFSFEDTLCFEEYYEKIKHLLPPITIVISNNPNGSSENEGEEGNDEGKGSGESQSYENGDSEGEGDQSSDGENKITQQAAQHSFETAALWEEDEEICCGINKIIQDAENSQQWGSLSGDLKELIKASCRIDMDYRRMLSH
ncbi:MAG: hypothetical protein J6W76_04365, partial [Spirochaetales bacterium]|nr:hypothetical protein [Spirochaetales bacterium]